MDAKRVINIDGIEKELPPDVDMLGEEDLYSVPFSMLCLAADEANTECDDGYQWTNPRRLGSIEGTTLGRGFDKQDMQELYNDIKDEGLMFPLIARWLIKDDALTIQVLDGERRWRCMDRQLKKRKKSGVVKRNPGCQPRKFMPRFLAGSSLATTRKLSRSPSWSATAP